jgi:hypothetical protein
VHGHDRNEGGRRVSTTGAWIYPKPERDEARATVACAYCKARAGKPCRKTRGYEVGTEFFDYVHMARMRLWESNPPKKAAA